MTLLELATKARDVKYTVAALSTEDKNSAIMAVADALEANASDIISANAIDMKNGETKGLSQGLLDRLKLDESRIKGIADGLRHTPSCSRD